jgi:hypothetical protein
VYVVLVNAANIDTAPVGSLVEITPDPSKPTQTCIYLLTDSGWTRGYATVGTDAARVFSGATFMSLGDYSDRAEIYAQLTIVP